MFDIGATELLVVAIIMILVVGPKDLPGVLRNFAQFAGKARRMANDFQYQFNQALKEAEKETGLDETRKQIKEASKVDLGKTGPDLIGIKTADGAEVPNGKAAQAASVVRPVSVTESGPDSARSEAEFADLSEVKAASAEPIEAPKPIDAPKPIKGHELTVTPAPDDANSANSAKSAQS